MKRMLLILIISISFFALAAPAAAQDPSEDPFDGGFAVNQEAEIFTMGGQNDSLHGWAFDWLSAQDSIILVGEGSFPESYQCGEKRDIAAADFNGDYMDELVVAWNRSDGGVFVGIPTIDRNTLAPDPAGWHVPDPPITAGVLYAADTLAQVLGEIRVVTGDFYDDPAMEFVLAYLAANGTVTLTVFDVDTSTLIPEARGTISDQAIHTWLPDVQKFGTASRFDIAAGDLDNDGTDEILLVASDPSHSPETDLMVDIYDYDTTGHSISLVTGHQVLANLNYPAVSCLRRIAAATGDFDADSLDEIAFIGDWARTDEDTLHYASTRFLDFSGDMTAIERSWDWDTTGWAHLEPEQSLNQNVNALLEYNGDLIAAGHFTNVHSVPYGGDIAFNKIARWDGSAWHSLEEPFTLNDDINALTVYNGDLIAGGKFYNAPYYRIARWDGLQWHALGEGFNEAAFALTVYNGDLIAAGHFTNVHSVPYGGDIAFNKIARWDGSAWHNLGEPFTLNDDINALAVYNGDLIAGGKFYNAPYYRIARWDGSNWYELGSGMNNTVRALTVFDGDLYAGGDFTTAGGIAANRIARWDGSTWYPVGDGFNASVYSLGVRTKGYMYSNLVAGGDMYSNEDGWEYYRITWFFEGADKWAGFLQGTTPGADGRVRAIIEYDDNLIFGGDFNVILQGGSWPNIPSHRIGRVKQGGYLNFGLLDSLEAKWDLAVDIIAEDVDFAADGADEVIIRGYHEPSMEPPYTGRHNIDVHGIDASTFTGCYRGSFYAANDLSGAEDICAGRRTMAVGNFIDDTTGHKEILLLVGDTLYREAMLIQAWEIDSLVTCGDPELYKLSYKTGWIDSSNSMTGLVLADIDTATIVLGTPSYHLVTDMLQPLVVLNAPPSHFDILDETVYDVNFLLDETPNPQECETYSVYQKKTGYTTEMSTEVNRDWGISSSLDVSVGTPGAKVKAHLGANYGESSTWAAESRETIEFTLTANAETDDQIFATQLDYQIWEYPVLRGGVELEGGGVVVVSPVTSNNIFAAAKSSFRELWIPNHEVGNLLSYQNITDDNVMVGSENIICDGTGFVTDNVSHFEWEVLEENFEQYYVEDSYSAGMEVGASVSGGGSFFGFSWGVEVGLEYTYSQEEINTYTTQVTDACQFQAFIGCVGTSASSDRSAIIIPYAYWANNGALVLDYTVQPSAPGGDPSWWQIHYNDPDPAFILPWRLDKEKGDEGMTEVARYETREIIFHPGEPDPGELDSITARVHNFSLVPTASQVAVSFYLGDPDNGGLLLTDPGGESVFWTPDVVPPQGEQLVRMAWQVPAEGNINRCQRIWAVIDPDNDVTPEVHDNDDPRTNNKGWKMLYVNTDAICIDSDGDGYGDPAFVCHNCLGIDNCPDVPNPLQEDSNGDGIGDACQWVCGDANGDQGVNVGDAVYLLNYVFRPSECATNPPIGCPPEFMAAGDANGDTNVNIGDIVYLNNFIFNPSQCATNPPIGCPPTCGS